jgi:sec-independent protein translocase protein TatA
MQIEHILFAAAIFAILFGGKKIPEMMKGLGEGIRSFKNAVKDVEKDLTLK